MEWIDEPIEFESSQLGKFFKSYIFGLDDKIKVNKVAATGFCGDGLHFVDGNVHETVDGKVVKFFSFFQARKGIIIEIDFENTFWVMDEEGTNTHKLTKLNGGDFWQMVFKFFKKDVDISKGKLLFGEKI